MTVTRSSCFHIWLCPCMLKFSDLMLCFVLGKNQLLYQSVSLRPVFCLTFKGVDCILLFSSPLCGSPQAGTKSVSQFNVSLCTLQSSCHLVHENLVTPLTDVQGGPNSRLSSVGLKTQGFQRFYWLTPISQKMPPSLFPEAQIN